MKDVSAGSISPPLRAVLPCLLPLTFCVLSLGCQSSTAQNGSTAPTTEGPAVSVTVAQVRLHSWPTRVRVQGSLVGDEEAIVGAKVAGRVQVETANAAAAGHRHLRNAIAFSRLRELSAWPPRPGSTSGSAAISTSRYMYLCLLAEELGGGS